MNNLYTNRNLRSDFVDNGFVDHVENGMDIYIASAFFTDMDVINRLLENQCHVRIIVRLGFPTEPHALEELIKNDNVEARFYTSHSFHPKMYIFGDKYILVGSANLTKSAMISNQEIVVGINSEDIRFGELSQLFLEYWDEAVVLNKELISSYRQIYKKYDPSQLVYEFENAVINTLGDANFSNINRGKKKASKKSIFLDTYRKSYQESVSAFKKIQDLYVQYPRKVSESEIPLRIEIDSFFSFVRDCHAKNEIWKEQPLGWDNQKKTLLNSLIEEWLDTAWRHFEVIVVKQNYPLIKKVFNTPESIENSSMHDIVNALVVLHSFHDRLRFFSGGLTTLKTKFLETNDTTRIKRSLKHLLYGKGDIVERMSDLLYDDAEYKLNEFGQANIQELVGWISQDNLPVVNGRTTKILRYFGFNVRQL